MDIKASYTSVSDVSARSAEPSHLLVDVTGSVVSHDSVDSVSVPLTVVVVSQGNGKSSVGSASDGSGSPGPDPPLLFVTWVVVLDSESILVSSDVLIVGKSSSGVHLSLDLELTTSWISWEWESSSVEAPSEGLVARAVVPVDHSVVAVVLGLSSEASATWVSQVLASATEVRDLLVHSLLGSESLKDGSLVVSHESSLPGCDGIVSLLVRSNGSSSSVEDEPLSLIPWLMVLDSELVG